MNPVLVDKIQKLQDYQDRDSVAIEEEITSTIENHLLKTVRGTHVIRPNKNYFKHLYHPVHGYEITELDGILILSNDPQDMKWQVPTSTSSGNATQPILNAEKKQRIAKKSLSLTNEAYQKTTKKQMILIEAKHYVDKEKVDKKINQFIELRYYFDCAKKIASNASKFTREFVNTVQQFNLHDYDDICLYIGGPVFEKDIERYIQIKSSENNIAGKIRLIKLSGNRYRVQDV